jgi:endonuclease G
VVFNRGEIVKKILLLISFSVALFATEVTDFISKHQCDQVIDKQIYSVCYSYKYKGALGGWTTLYGDKVNAVNIKKRPRFYENKTIPKKYRTKYSDYTGVGRTWNRGHFIIADADADYSKKSLHLVYDMSQIQPQAAKVNQKTWIKVEKYGRMLATKLGSVESVTIADYRGATKKIKNNIVIPVGFYRVYFNDAADYKRCFYYKNNPFVDYKNDKLKDHLVDCDTVHAHR